MRTFGRLWLVFKTVRTWTIDSTSVLEIHRGNLDVDSYAAFRIRQDLALLILRGQLMKTMNLCLLIAENVVRSTSIDENVTPKWMVPISSHLVVPPISRRPATEMTVVKLSYQLKLTNHTILYK